ncbi:MAG TPA: transcriptional regulator [Deltaproteobacteria bacterium]|nr:transcriptional regulator [Deltaproteobacteria bacterium]HCP44758.1 transcriptional regulator [Deltaproteobacteria bacterium]
MKRLLRQIWGVFKKDLLLDLRSGGRLTAVAFFAGMTLLLFSFAAPPDGISLGLNAAGYLWLALLLASVLALGESFRIEVEDEALEGLRLLPVDPMALYYGKALATTTLLIGLCVLVLPAALVLYGVAIKGAVWKMIATLILGCAGLAAPGTLYSAMTSRARGQDVLLPLLLFPLVIPVLVSAVKATSLLLHGDINPGGSASSSHLSLLLCFDVVYWSVCGLLFGKVIDE